MHYRLTALLGLMTMIVTLSAQADASTEIPDKVRNNILKRHPQATDMQASHETHFGQKLLEVGFKDETGREASELFTDKGHLFTNENKLEDIGGISQAAIATLKQEFPNYTLQKAEMIVNPNGIGEEYEIYLHANGGNWKISINNRGIIQEKLELNP